MKNKTITIFTVSIFLLTILQSFVATSTGLEIKNSDFEVSSTSPSYFSWKDVNGTDYTTPIRDLRPIPTCEAMALCASMETMIQYKIGYPFDCDLSEAHLFFCSGGTHEWGTYMEDAANYLVDYGVPDEACWPYPKEKHDCPCDTTSPDWQNRTVKITNWHYLPENRDAIKTALINYGPVVAYFDVFEDFMYYFGGIYKHRWGAPSGGHWIAIIGYNDNQGCWICENSYGVQWGEEGYFRIKYGECNIEKHAIYLEDVYGNFPIKYVDDNNTAGPWDGTPEYPYQHIQDGIDNVFEGYTIYVKNGTYYENVLVNKTINLDGEKPSSTIIDGGGVGNVVAITAENVRLSGFTIQNGGNDLFDAGIKTRLYWTNGSSEIKNNIIKNNKQGIYLYWSSWNEIRGNIIEDNSNGIYLWGSYNNIIDNNTIQNNTNNGIEFEYSQGYITGNAVVNNGKIGMYLNEKSNVCIVNGANLIKDNAIGVMVNNSKCACVIRNNFIDNDQQFVFKNSYYLCAYHNYWSDWERAVPRMIKGTIGENIELPWITIDWFPSKKLIQIS